MSIILWHHGLTELLAFYCSQWDGLSMEEEGWNAGYCLYSANLHYGGFNESS